MAFQVIFNICIDLYFKLVQMHKQVYHWIHSKFCFDYSFIISKPWNTGYSLAIMIWWDLNSNYHSVEILRDVSLWNDRDKRERKLGSRRSRLGRCYLWFIASQRHCPFWGQLSEPITWAANAMRLITILHLLPAEKGTKRFLPVTRSSKIGVLVKHQLLKCVIPRKVKD